MARLEEIRNCRCQLETVRTAITQVEANGQSFQIDGVGYTRATISTLYTREKSLLARLSRLTRSRPMSSVANFNGGSYS